MKRVLAAAIGIVLLSASPAVATTGDSCDEIKADCAKVRRIIRQLWPAPEEDHAIACFGNESGLFKWSNKNRGHHQDPEGRVTEYKGITQMSKSLREQTGWAWPIYKQLRSAYRVWRYERRHGDSEYGWGPWTAESC